MSAATTSVAAVAAATATALVAQRSKARPAMTVAT